MHGGVERTRRPTPTFSAEKHAGALAAEAWLRARGLYVPLGMPWEVVISLDASPSDGQLRITISSCEWGLAFRRGEQTSWIRVTDLPFINERDDHALLRLVPPLRELGSLIQLLEDRHGLSFNRDEASIRTTLPNAESAIRNWIDEST
jgi:hypothetical protein